MAKRSFFKDLNRSILRSITRFLSILAIIALGVGFYAGINATEPDMLLSADKYYKDHNLSDFRIISPMGFEASDVLDAGNADGVSKVQEGYSKDLFMTSSAGTISTARVFSYDPQNALTADALNIPVVIEGKMPEHSGEIALEAGYNVPAAIKIGSQVKVSLPADNKLEDFLKTDTYTVVGRIRSPLYIDFERGQTNIGDGSINFYAYMAKTDFTMEKVTDLFVRTVESPNLAAYSQDYQNHLIPIKNTFDILGKEMMTRVKQPLLDELNEGRVELQMNREKAEKELAEGEKKLLDAEQEILDGEKELQNQRTRYTRELADQKAQIEKGQAELAAGQQTWQQNRVLWQQGYDSYNQGLAELDASKAQLDSAKNQITEAENTLAASKAQLDSAKTQLDSLKRSLDALTSIKQSLFGLVPTITEDGFNQLVEEIRIYAPDLADLIAATYHYDDPFLLPGLSMMMDEAIAPLEQAYAAGKAEYDAGLAQYNQGQALVADNKTKYEQGLAAYKAGLAQINAAKAQLDSGKIELDQGKTLLDANDIKLTAGAAALVKGEAELKSQLAAGAQQLKDARSELAEGRTVFEVKKADALQQLADADAKISDAAFKIDKIPDQWFVFSRSDNPGYSSYGDDANRIGAVAKVFPLFFFLVAALVCLTTMTRMVEEERIQIGTLKALGYSTLTISSKYLIYALLASLTGALLGLVTGFRLFPGVIMNAYGLMYQIPERLTPFHLDYAIISILIAVATTVLASLLATLQELRATPSALMQPKAPKPGKRIFLERIKPVWSRLSFSYKVTARNIFRYKRRFLMTVIGIAGCTALLVTGFGLKDSIGAIMGKQFAEIFVYDGQISINLAANESERDLSRILGENPEITGYIQTMNETVSALTAQTGRAYEASILIPEDTRTFKNFYDLHDRKTGNKLTITDDGAVISEKLANLLEIKSGDSFTYRDSENRIITVRVSAVAENYLAHFIYLSPAYFSQITSRTPEYSNVAFNVKNASLLDQKAFKEDLLDHDGILGLMFTRSIADNFNKTITSLNYVVLLLILAAGALAFVVLYNLTNINITERIREIATIKVLGFRDKEVSAYVYRENIILTMIGTLVGLALGFFMHRFVMGTMEIDMMMFGKDVHPISYLLSAGLTMSFTVLVNISMFYRLRKISMVESLKSVD